MQEVANQLWIGNALEARNPRLLFDHAFVAVVDVAYEESPAALPRELIYLRIPLLDGEDNEPTNKPLKTRLNRCGISFLNSLS